MIRGCDVSPAQGVVDWAAVKAAGLEFAYLEESIGNDTPTRSAPVAHFVDNARGCDAAGIPWGLYIFGYCGLVATAANPSRDPRVQMQLAFSRRSGLVGRLPPMLDMEWPAPQDFAKWGVTPTLITDWCCEAADEILALWGRKPLGYMYPWWARCVSPQQREDFADHFEGLAVADYAHYNTSTPPDGASPIILPPFTDWAMWQHSGGGMKMPSGCPGDFDVMRDETFAALLAP